MTNPHTILEIHNDRALIRRAIETEDYDAEGFVVGKDVEDVDYRAHTLDQWVALDEVMCSGCRATSPDACECDDRSDDAGRIAHERAHSAQALSVVR